LKYGDKKKFGSLEVEDREKKVWKLKTGEKVW
jgi:hypothetical protein